ncbi:hypothetical protein JHK82_025676 [Glycine max]|nr:hypothetical protein JHK86_025803 [Glycine max]KAG5134488.1 hypothetical protein JHK82_025676 [Glycine max]
MALSATFVKTNRSILPFHQNSSPNHGRIKQLCVRASASSLDDDEDRTVVRKEKDGWKIKFSSQKPATPLLDTINYPAHMKNLSLQDLEQLAAELRADVVHSVSNTGGHLSSSLGVVELTVALHHVFNTPEDKIIWDVGHQAYPHKILTGRRSRMHTIRKTSGLAGFPKREESVYDVFGTGHSSTSISAGLGMAVARDLLGKKNSIVSVIGDGAMTAGQAYEAMNNAGFLDSNMIIILNDNKQVSLPTATIDGPATPVGALSSALSKIQASTKFRKLREAAKFVPTSGHQLKPKSSTLTYTQYFAESLIKEAEIDNKIVAIHAAMGGGTGLNYFHKRFPDRCFDVGIAEQHAVTFAAGLAAEGLKPFCAIYSSFLQRGYDQIGKGRILRQGSRVAILGYGSVVQQCLQAAQMLKPLDISVTVADARFCKPLDTDLIKLLGKEHEFLLTVEEGSIGGFGSHVSHFLSIVGLLDGPLKWRPMMLPDRYIEHGSPQDQTEEAGLSSKNIAATVLSLLERPKEALLFK